MNYRKRKRPPLWYIPILFKNAPGLVRATKRKQYFKAMEFGLAVMGSHKVKKRAFKEYQPNEHDVFVCTYSKSGTYWMMQIVTQIANKGEGNFEHIHDWVPWPDMPMDNMVFLREPTWKHVPTGKRAIKTHLETEYVPYSEKSRYVVVIRDPKDVIISSFYFSDSIIAGLSSIGLDAWMHSFVKNETPYGSWAKQVASFWAWRDRPNVKIYHFEDMKANLSSVVSELNTFLGTQLNADELRKVVEKSEFKSMKAEEAKFLPPTPPGIDRSTLTLLRRGAAGVAKEELNPEQMALVDREMRRQLAELGSDFPYDDLY